MTPAEIKRRLMSELKKNATLGFDEACFHVSTAALELKDAGEVTSVIVTGKDDRCTGVDVDLPNGDTVEVEIP